MKRIILLVALVLGGLAVPGAVIAQAGAALTLRQVQSDQFPVITGFFEARDASGAQISNLQAEDLSVLEDGQSLAIEQLRRATTGLNLYVTFDPSQAFAIRNSEGQRRYDLVRAEVLSWVRPLNDGQDFLISLLTPQGVLASQSVPSAWLAAFEDYQPNTNIIDNDMQVFSLALNQVAQPASQATMGNAIWLIAAVPPAEALTTLGEWQTTLLAQNTPLFVWLIDASSRLRSEESLALQALAEATGGQAFTFSESGTFPDPDGYFDPLTQAYFFQYTSQVTSSGEHSLQLQWQAGENLVLSNEAEFSAEILPPNPIFLTPPSFIERLPYEDDPHLLAPFSQPLEILIEFPDNFQRGVVRSTLYVNGQPVAENTAPPFNNFIWDLRPYEISQELLLQVEVEDELGLVGRSIEHSIDIAAQLPANFWQSLLARGAPAMAFSVLLIAAGAVFLVLVLSGRIQPPALQTMRMPEKEGEADPVSGIPARPRAVRLDPDSPLAMPAPRALAYLQRLAESSRVADDMVLPISAEMTRIGSAQEGNQVVLEDESVDTLHATLTRLDNGIFVLADQGSEAGTWLNYAPVSREGSRVEEGDLVHIGRVAFRFSLLPNLKGRP